MSLHLASEADGSLTGLSPEPVGSDAVSRCMVSELRRIADV